MAGVSGAFGAETTAAGAAAGWGFLAAFALANTCFKYSLGSVSLTPPASAGAPGEAPVTGVAPAEEGASDEAEAGLGEGADSPTGASCFFMFKSFSSSSKLTFFNLAIRVLASSTMAPVSWIRTNFS